MTAVVGILNKKAIAIAADSAVTYNGKIYNKANKVFSLSKCHPVGVMIHNNGDFMGTPWETIIKMYRAKLKDQSFDTLELYKDDFISYIKEKTFFCPDDYQRKSLKRFFLGINYLFKSLMKDKIKDDDPNWEQKSVALLKELSIEHAKLYSPNEILPEFTTYSFEDFENYVDSDIQDVFDEIFVSEGIPIEEELSVLLKKAYYQELIVKEFNTTNYTGIVIAGFGEHETFPSLIPLHIYLGFENKLRYYVNTDKVQVISHENISGIATFAQSDVMFTILTGIAPELKESYNLNLKNLLSRLFDEILLPNFTGEMGDLKFLLSRINKNDLIGHFSGLMDDAIVKKYITPLHEAISGLAKEDLGEMAESLIYLTYLQRRITNAEESVGGPVDVAVLTKGDGFIWIKQKQYFKPELNSHYFKNYFT